MRVSVKHALSELPLPWREKVGMRGSGGAADASPPPGSETLTQPSPPRGEGFYRSA
jgi:hypothetical protein